MIKKYKATVQAGEDFFQLTYAVEKGKVFSLITVKAVVLKGNFFPIPKLFPLKRFLKLVNISELLESCFKDEEQVRLLLEKENYNA